MDIVKFLNARYNETEIAARTLQDCGTVHTIVSKMVGEDRMSQRAGAPHWFTTTRVLGFLNEVSPDRVLADLAAKRRLLAFAAEYAIEMNDHYGTSAEPVLPNAENPVLRILAAVYAEHPDYDKAWAVTEG